MEPWHCQMAYLFAETALAPRIGGSSTKITRTSSLEGKWKLITVSSQSSYCTCPTSWFDYSTKMLDPNFTLSIAKRHLGPNYFMYSICDHHKCLQNLQGGKTLNAWKQWRKMMSVCYWPIQGEWHTEWFGVNLQYRWKSLLPLMHQSFLCS